MRGPRDSSVGIETRLPSGHPRNCGSNPGTCKISLSSETSGQVLKPIHAPIQRVTGIKRPGREAEHSPPSQADDKNEWKCASIPIYAFIAWTGTALDFELCWFEVQGTTAVLVASSGQSNYLTN
jgi:hypothetical protein